MLKQRQRQVLAAAEAKLLATITIAATVFPNVNYTGSVFTWRIFSDKSWVAADGTIVPARGDQGTFYKEYTVSVAGTNGTVPQITLLSQTDAPNEKNARYMIYWYVDGVEKDMVLANTLGAFQVPDTPASTTWGDLEQYNFGTSRRYYKDDGTYSALVIDQKIAAVTGTTNLATSTVAALPTASTVGRQRLTTTVDEGIYIDNGTQWYSLTHGVFDFKRFGGVGDGSTSNTTILQSIITAIGSNQGTVTFPYSANPYVIGTISVPSNVTLDFNDGGTVKVTTGATITVVSPTDNWPTRQLFTNATAGLGTVSFSGSVSTPVFSPYWWGTNAAAFQAAVTAAGSVGGGIGGVVKWEGVFTTDAAITIPSQVTIDGSGLSNGTILCAANSGFIISAGASFVTLRGFQLQQSTPDSITPNAFVGITVNGTFASQSYRNTFRDLYIDGFHTGIIANGIGNSVFDNIETKNGKYGFQSGDQSLNDKLINSRFLGTGIAGGVGIQIGDSGSAHGPEGWEISNIFTYNNARGVWFLGAAFCALADSVLDYNSEYGVLIQSSVNAVTGITVHNNKMFMTGTADTGIFTANVVAVTAGQSTGYDISGNDVFYYAGASLTTGIRIGGTVEDNHRINNNSVRATTVDIRIDAGTNISLDGNHCLANGFQSAVKVYYGDTNVGSLIPSAADVMFPLMKPRFIGNGNNLATGNIALSAGWGTAPVLGVSAKDTGGRITIQCDAVAGANPTVTITFVDGTWTTIPAIVSARGDSAAPTTGYWKLTTPSATAPIFTFVGTPVAASTYILDFITMGRQ